ncbi:MAG: polysaccharide biosynthesis protein [Oscillospiraceae bacterium]|nr:polysaccharide biosynthesis protein [Oscillospiraceae bacterium]
MGNPRRQSFLSGAMILTATIAVTKVIGALYKIPLGNLLDSEGMAHFYAAYNVYRLLLTLSTAGLPLALSRMVSEAEALGQENQKHRIFHVALVLFLALGAVSSAAMALLSGPLSRLLHDTLAQTAVLALAPAVLFVCLMAPIRGFTQGQGNMKPTAASEIIESLSKAVIGYLLAWYLLRQGFPRHIAAAGSIGGVTVATALALLALLIYLLGRRGRRPSADVPQSRRAILRRLLRIGVPITAGACGMSLITLLDTSLVLGTLQGNGCTQAQATALYGEYTYALNLFTLPAAFIAPMTISLIPAISADKARRDAVSARRHTAAAFRFTALLALPLGAGLSVLARPLMDLLYPDIPQTAAAAAGHLTVLGAASVFVCVMTLTNGLLQANGREDVPLWTLLFGGLAKIISNYLLVGNPAIGIRGAAWSTLLCYGLIAALNLIAVARSLPERPGYFSVLLRPLAATAVMAAGARAIFGLLSRGLSPRPAAALTVLIAAAVYAVLALAVGAVRREDLVSLPKGEKIADFLHVR